MTCPEKIRLQHLYETAIRRWAQVQASSQFVGQSTYLTEEIKKRVLAERKAAKIRLSMHQKLCNTCRHPITQRPGR
jgi:hypothetical protein